MPIVYSVHPYHHAEGGSKLWTKDWAGLAGSKEENHAKCSQGSGSGGYIGATGMKTQ